MKKLVSFVALIACCIGLSGCSSTPEIQIEIPVSLAGKVHAMSAKILESGGLAAVGSAQSKSLNIALNKAQADGRIKLADLLELKTEVLQTDVAEGTVPSIIANHIQDLAPKELQHETTNGVVIAYALMELDPNVLNQETETLSAE